MVLGFGRGWGRARGIRLAGFLPWADFSVWGPQTGRPQRSLLGQPTFLCLPPSPCGLDGGTWALSPSRGRRKGRVCTDLGPPLTGPGSPHIDLGPGSQAWPTGPVASSPRLRSPSPTPTPISAEGSPLCRLESLPVDTTLRLLLAFSGSAPSSSATPTPPLGLNPAHFHYLSISSSVKREG